MNNIRVVIIDDSKLYRDLIEHLLSFDKQITIVGKATDPYEARDIIKQTRPDVITLDIEMPKMNGLKFLQNLMRLHPLPVIMISSLTGKGARESVKALELGAVDVMQKMTQTEPELLTHYRDELISKVRYAARKDRPHLANSKKTLAIESIAKKSFKIIAIGASTGGIPALKELIPLLPTSCPPVVITQHIQQGFIVPFVELVNDISDVNVCVATDGDRLLPGHVYLSPSDKDLSIVRNGAHFHCQLNTQTSASFHHPCVDVLFNSLSQISRAHACFIILTGMGHDGLNGLRAARAAGYFIIAQDKASSAVWGMPRVVIEAGLCDAVLSLTDIKQLLSSLKAMSPFDLPLATLNTTSEKKTPAPVNPLTQLSTTPSPQKNIKQAITVFIKQLDEEHTFLSDKLIQIERLLDDASKKSRPELANLKAMDYDVNHLIQLLQLDDLIVQLIEKMASNLNGIQSQFTDLMTQCNHIKSDTDGAAVAEAIEQSAKRLKQANSLFKRDSVTQTNLTAGDIELF